MLLSPFTRRFLIHSKYVPWTMRSIATTYRLRVKRETPQAFDEICLFYAKIKLILSKMTPEQFCGFRQNQSVPVMLLGPK